MTALIGSAMTGGYGGADILKGCTVEVESGEIAVIVGPNGAGKSSMLNVINGFYHPQEGEVWFRGEKRPSMKPYEIAEDLEIRRLTLHEEIVDRLREMIFQGDLMVGNRVPERDLCLKFSIFFSLSSNSENVETAFCFICCNSNSSVVFVTICLSISTGVGILIVKLVLAFISIVILL